MTELSYKILTLITKFIGLSTNPKQIISIECYIKLIPIESNY
jgi:hypothetical protein